MTITAEILADSANTSGERITTMRLRYPLFVHAEFMTHRVFSRNARSGRAVPIERMIQEVLDDPAIPERFGKHKAGMQDDGEHNAKVCLDDEPIAGFSPKDAWKYASIEAVKYARAFRAAGYSKQVVNRLLDPFRHIDVIVTATEWGNFFALRRHEAADPTMRALADAMWEAREASIPRVLRLGQWHVPMAPRNLDPSDPGTLQVSVARCARISYGRSEGRAFGDDVRLYETLLSFGHWSPFEHQARANPGVTCRNFRGWTQLRDMLDCGANG